MNTELEEKNGLEERKEEEGEGTESSGMEITQQKLIQFEQVLGWRGGSPARKWECCCGNSLFYILSKATAFSWHVKHCLRESSLGISSVS